MSSTSPTDNDQLRLNSIQAPHIASAAIMVFADWQAAVTHLRDHLLATPECEAWAIVIPTYREIVDSAPDSRWRYAQAAGKSNGIAAQKLYDSFSDTVALENMDAGSLGWCKGSGVTTVTLGSSGVLTVIEQPNGIAPVIRTAFLPGQGDAGIVTASHSLPALGWGLRREGGMTSGRPGRAKAGSKREDRARQQREQEYDDSERLYYRVFRPAVQFIRERAHLQRDMLGKLRRCDYALLKDVLPPLSQLKLNDWRARRDSCRTPGKIVQ